MTPPKAKRTKRPYQKHILDPSKSTKKTGPLQNAQLSPSKTSFFLLMCFLFWQGHSVLVGSLTPPKSTRDPARSGRTQPKPETLISDLTKSGKMTIPKKQNDHTKTKLPYQMYTKIAMTPPNMGQSLLVLWWSAYRGPPGTQPE